MANLVMTDEHMQALDKILLLARYLNYQSAAVMDHKKGEPFPFRPGELAAASKLLYEIEEIFSELVSELPTEGELESRRQRSAMDPADREELEKSSQEIHDASFIVSAMSGPDIPLWAAFARALKADPEGVKAKMKAMLPGEESGEETSHEG